MSGRTGPGPDYCQAGLHTIVIVKGPLPHGTPPRAMLPLPGWETGVTMI